MIATNTAVAKWCFQHGIPIPYRVFDPRRSQFGSYALQPETHQGIRDVYTHVTSPIRRFPDIVVMQQVAAAVANRSLPYDAGEIADFCEQLNALQKHPRFFYPRNEDYTFTTKSVQQLVRKFTHTATPVQANAAEAILQAIKLNGPISNNEIKALIPLIDPQDEDSAALLHECLERTAKANIMKWITTIDDEAMRYKSLVAYVNHLFTTHKGQTTPEFIDKVYQLSQAIPRGYDTPEFLIGKITHLLRNPQTRFLFLKFLSNQKQQVPEPVADAFIQAIERNWLSFEDAKALLCVSYTSSDSIDLDNPYELQRLALERLILPRIKKLGDVINSVFGTASSRGLWPQLAIVTTKQGRKFQAQATLQFAVKPIIGLAQHSDERYVRQLAALHVLEQMFGLDVDPLQPLMVE